MFEIYNPSLAAMKAARLFTFQIIAVNVQLENLFISGAASMDAWELIKATSEDGDGAKMARLFEKTAEWWNSHGRPPKTVDPNGTGNLSPLDHYLRYMDRRYAANQGSAVRLHRAVTAEIDARFGLNQSASDVPSLRTVRRKLRKEAFDVFDALDECEINEASADDLSRWDTELIQLEDEVAKARARIRVERETRNIRTQNGFKSEGKQP